MCFYVDYVCVCIPVHTGRCNYGSVSLGMLVNMSICVYMCRCMCRLVDLYMYMNVNVLLCRYVYMCM